MLFCGCTFFVFPIFCRDCRFLVFYSSEVQCNAQGTFESKKGISVNSWSEREVCLCVCFLYCVWAVSDEGTDMFAVFISGAN